jgi:hypothetical protein
MNWLLLYIFSGIAVAMIVPAIWRKDYRLQFPCLAGFTVLYQVALPMASLLKHPDEISQTAISRFGVMAILCLCAAWAGYLWHQPRSNTAYYRFNENKLIVGVFFLVAGGAYFAWKTAHTEADLDPETHNWTGTIVIYVTLAQTMRFGGIIAAILFFRTRKWVWLFIALPQLLYYTYLFYGGRRSATGEAIVVICMLFFFYRKWVVPMWMMIAGTFALALFCFNINVIRQTADDSLVERMQAIQATDPLESITTEGMAEKRTFVEIYNAANYMEAKAKGGHYNCGLVYWNSLVFGFVPAQILGREFKNSLMIQLPDDTSMTGFTKAVGTCETGIAEVFMAFGYFGFGLFFVLGVFMRWLWEGAQKGSVLHQFLLMICTLRAVMSFSSQLWTIVNLLVSIAIFAGPWLWWSYTNSSTNERLPRRVPAGGRK